MSNTPTHEETVRKSLADYKEPDRLASGQWIMRCSGAKYTPNDEYDENGDGPIGVLLLTHVPVRPGDNVDTEKVESGTWRGKRVFTRLNVRDEADAYQVSQVIAGHGISVEDIEATGTSFAEIFASLMEQATAKLRTRTVGTTVGMRTFKRRDGSTAIENTLTNFTPA